MSTQDIIQMPCPKCNSLLQLPKIHAGKKGRCKNCQEIFVIPQESPQGRTALPSKAAVAPVARPATKKPQAPSGNELVPLDMNDPFAVNSSNASAFASLSNNLQAAPPPAPFGGVNPAFADDDFKLAPLPQESAPAAMPFGGANQYAPPAINPYEPSSYQSSSSAGGISWGKVGSGIGMMILAVVWFFGALIFANRIFFYPPILLIIGFVTMINGFMGSTD